MNKLNVILLVGGKNTRLKNLNKPKFSTPKALQKINSNNLILHVIKNFTNNEFNNFILPIGHYKESFENFFKNRKKINGKKCSIFFDYKKYLKSINDAQNTINILLFNSGLNSNKAKRALMVINKLKLNEFAISYGDGVGDIKINDLYKKHIKSKCIASCAAVQPHSQYGHFIFRKKTSKKNINTNDVIDFIEKPIIDDWVNIGYFFFKKKSINFFLKYYKDDLEMGIIKKIANNNKLLIHKHYGFWKSVDTQKDVKELSEILKNDKK